MRDTSLFQARTFPVNRHQHEQTAASACSSFLLCQQKICLQWIHWYLWAGGCHWLEGRTETETFPACSPSGSGESSHTEHFVQLCAERAQGLWQQELKKWDITGRSTSLFTSPGPPYNPPHWDKFRWEMLYVTHGTLNSRAINSMESFPHHGTRGTFPLARMLLTSTETNSPSMSQVRKWKLIVGKKLLAEISSKPVFSPKSLIASVTPAKAGIIAGIHVSWKNLKNITPGN